MQEGCTIAGNATAFVAVVLGIIIHEPGLDALVGFPTDLSRILVIHPNPPLCHRSSVEDVLDGEQVRSESCVCDHTKMYLRRRGFSTLTG